MERAKVEIRQTLEDARTFAKEHPSNRISEADTKANFIEPIIAALGWRGILHVTREYFVQSSQQRIDYLLRNEGRPLLAVEAKAFGVELTEKEASQLVSYCVIEGIEWAALTNGRRLEVFNTHLTPDLNAKRLVRLDLLDFDDDPSFEAILETLWLLSRESLSNPTTANAWMNTIRLDRLIELELADPNSSTIRELAKNAGRSGISASTSDVVERIQCISLRNGQGGAQRSRSFFNSTSSNPTSNIPSPSASSIVSDQGRIRPSSYLAADPTRLADPPRTQYRATIADLIRTKLIRPGERLVLLSGGAVIAEATVGNDGRIIFDGISYATPSDHVFARLLGRKSLNGWTSWYVLRPDGRTLIDEIRRQYLQLASSGGG